MERDLEQVAVPAAYHILFYLCKYKSYYIAYKYYYHNQHSIIDYWLSVGYDRFTLSQQSYYQARRFIFIFKLELDFISYLSSEQKTLDFLYTI